MGTKTEASARRVVDLLLDGLALPAMPGISGSGRSPRNITSFSSCLSRHSSNIFAGSYTTLFTLMILSPTATAFSAEAVPAHCRFHASMAPSGRTPSTKRTWSLAWWETLRPRSAPSAFRSVKLKMPLPGAAPRVANGEGASGVGAGVREFTSDKGVRCGVCAPRASESRSGAAGVLGCAGNGKLGTSGNFSPAAGPPASIAASATAAWTSDERGVNGAGVKGSEPLSLVCGGEAVDAVLLAPAAAVAASTAPATPSFPPNTGPITANRVARFWMTCLSFSFSASSMRCLSMQLAISSASLLVFSLCF
mmetsp:Transcript_104697/g.223811  ORF Transcript_104697/g.223811 Transcript_104697/m.223811 type:complete len:308 (+) Transcript_104697:347-1270(+)